MTPCPLRNTVFSAFIASLLAALPARGSSPLVAWDFNEPSATANATGAGPGAFDLQLQNGATRTPGGQGLTSAPGDRALDLGSGTNARATGGNTPGNSLQGKDIVTYTAWVRITSPRAFTTFAPPTRIFERFNGTGLRLWVRPESESELRLQINSDSGNITSSSVVGGKYIGIRDTFPIYANQWNFIAVSYNGAANRARFYAGSAAGNDFRFVNEDTTNSLSAPVSFSPQAALTIGGEFNGLIDNVRIYNGELTETQIRAIYEGDLAGNNANYNEGGPLDLVSVRMGNIGAYGVTTRGNTVAGPRMPFGSAHPSLNTDGGSTSGGSEAKGPFGFSQLHVVGTGGDGKYGLFLVSPQKGQLRTVPNTNNQHRHGYDSWNIHTQIKQVHRYQAILRNATANQFRAEVTPTHHGAKYRFTNLASTTDNSHILLDCAWNIPSWVINTDWVRQRGPMEGNLTFDPATNTLTGWGRYRGGWLGSVPTSPRWHSANSSETDATVYFAARVSWGGNVTRTGYGTFYDDCNLLDGTPGRNTLTVGQRYLFYRRPSSTTWAVQVNDNFTNVGAPAFNSITEGQTVFQATGTTPASWQDHGSASVLMPVWTSGTLVTGRAYRIVRYFAGDDFTNVANPLFTSSSGINGNGTIFIATGATPANWTNGSVLEQTVWDNALTPNGTFAQSAAPGDRFGAYLSFSTPPGAEIFVDIAVSFKSIAQAQSYLNSQLVGKTFAQVESEALAAWQTELNRLTVEGGTPAYRRMFYSSLYRCFMMPADRTNDFNEFTPNYPLYDDHYATWDTWRTLFPLHVLINEEYAARNLQAFINRWDNLHAPSKPLHAYALADAFIGGKSGYGWATRQKQGGDGPDFVIQDALVKGVQGLTGSEWQSLLGVMRHSATRDDGNREFMGNTNTNPPLVDNLQDPPDFRWENGRAKNGGGMSQMLEYCYNDYGLALAERILGNATNQQTYANRSRFWENYFCNEDLPCGRWFNTSANGTGGDDFTYYGFIATRQWTGGANGTWVSWNATANKNTPPLLTWNGTDLVGAMQPGFYEGNAGMYTFFLPHDLKRLMDLSWRGATYNSQPPDFPTRRQHFAARINAMASFDLNNNPSNEFKRYLNAGNEPSFLVMRLFTYAGRPDLTSYWVRKHVIDNYNLREFPGDEDSGAMGSMFVFSAAGIFPNAGADLYFLNAPLFNKSTWQLAGNKTFVIQVAGNNASYDNAYIQSATLNGKPLNRAWLRHSEIAQGGTLTLVVGPNPSTWGQGADQLPPMSRNYADWATLYTNVTNPTADADNDGLSNLIEYAVHSNPNSAADNHGIPRLSHMTVGGNRVVTLAFDPSVAAIDLRYDIEYSTDGGQTWLPAGPSQVTLVRTGGPVMYRETSPGSAPWMRLKVTTLNGAFTSHDEPPAEDFVTWQTQNFPGNNNTSVIGATADPDADGVPNLLEFALGGDPNSPASRPQPTVGTTVVSGQPRLTLSFTPAIVDGLTYIIQASTDLSDWSDQTNVTSSLTPGQLYTFVDTADLSATPRRFLRLRVVVQ